MTDKYDFGPSVSFKPDENYKLGKKPRRLRLVTLRGPSMGGQYMVRAVVPVSIDLEELNAGIKLTLDIVENQMSVFKPDSCLMQFNRHPVGEWFHLPPETSDVFDIALEVGKLTGGALDITLGPLIELWGFGAQDQPKTIPHTDDLVAIKAVTGHLHLKFDRAGRRIMKTAACEISLNAVAKGYGADLVCEYLKSLAIADFVVEVAGEIVTAGQKPDGTKWRVAIERPLVGVSAAQQILCLSDRAIATSGDYRKYFERDGVRFSHVIAPKTQQPIKHKLAAVTVVDATSARADALATAMLVMGEGAAFEFAEQNAIAAYFIVKNDSDFEVVLSGSMKQYLESL